MLALRQKDQLSWASRGGEIEQETTRRRSFRHEDLRSCTTRSTTVVPSTLIPSRSLDGQSFSFPGLFQNPDRYG